MSEIKVNKLSPRSGTTVTLGDSGDTFSIPSGATLAIAGSVTGFTSAGIDDNATSVAITIDSSERVGIGTTSPEHLLDVISSDSVPARIRSTANSNMALEIDSASNRNANVEFKENDSSKWFVGNEASSDAFRFFSSTANSESMRISSAGLVGIGTSSPNAKLDILATGNNASAISTTVSDYAIKLASATTSNYFSNGLVFSEGNTSGSAIGSFDGGSSGRQGLWFATHDGSSMAERVRINSSGSVRIGDNSSYTADTSSDELVIGNTTSSSKTGLTILSSNDVSFSRGQISFADTNSNVAGTIKYNHGSGAQDAMIFNTNASEAMRIDSSGNVGIGTTNTQGRLLINTGASGSTFNPSNMNNGNISFSNASGGTAVPTIVGRSNNNAGLLLVGSSNNSHTSGDLVFDVRENDNTDFATLTGSGFKFSRFGNELMRLSRDGKLGIGTSQPKEKLDSRGSAVFSGDHATSTNAYGTAHGILLSSTSNLGKITAISNGSNDVKLELRGLDGGSANSNQLVLDGGTSNVGIGTSSPNTNLDISSSGNATINLKASGQSDGLQLSQLTADGGSSISATNNNYLKFSTNASERMRIDSSGKVGIGTSSPDRGLEVQGTNNVTSTLRLKNTAPDPDNIWDFVPQYNNGDLTILDDGTERMRIDSSGNLLVGTTTAQGSSGTTISQTGDIYASKFASTILTLNRTTTDGNIVDFRKDNSTVGSISARFGGIQIGSSDTGLLFNNSSKEINPTDADGTVNDNLTILGANNRRFKDLYLGGGIFLGGTGSANKLDDYEKGSWTVNVSDGSGNTVTGVGNGTYTKIGGLCLVQFALIATLTSLTSGDTLRITNIPFTGASGTGNRHCTSGVRHFDNVTLSSGYTFVNLVQNQATGYLNFREFGSGVASKDVTVGQFGSSTGTIQGSIIYRTD